jgi:hypothetical protein
MENMMDTTNLESPQRRAHRRRHYDEPVEQMSRQLVVLEKTLLH